MPNIRKYRKQIASLKPLMGGITYTPEKWAKQFTNKKLLNCLQIHNRKHIRRLTVINEFKKYFTGKNKNAIEPFLYTMIWGYDSNYGPHRTNEILKHKANLKLIKNGIDAMNNKDFDEAFNQLNKIKGLGISYLSKILYFGGRAKLISKYPLIFDIRVATALVLLTSGRTFDGLLKISPSDKLESYKNYNALLHKWAQTLSVHADQIEYFLFEQKF